VEKPRAPFWKGEKEETMAYFALIYELVDHYIERRAPLRAEHLKLASEAHARGEIVLAGAFTDPTDKALLIFRGEDGSAAERFVQQDPYVKNGLVKKWEVRPWTVVIGNSIAKP
jgi:uncharacterized protein